MIVTLQTVTQLKNQAPTEENTNHESMFCFKSSHMSQVTSCYKQLYKQAKRLDSTHSALGPPSLVLGPRS